MIRVPNVNSKVPCLRKILNGPIHEFLCSVLCSSPYVCMCVCVCVCVVRACVHSWVYAVYIIVVMISQYNKNVYRCCDQLFVQVFDA